MRSNFKAIISVSTGSVETRIFSWKQLPSQTKQHLQCLLFFSSSPSKSLYSARTLRRLVRPFPLQRVGPSQHPGWAQRGCHWSNLAIRPKRRRGGDRPWSIDPLEGDETTPARWTGGGFLPRPPICREHAHEQTDYYVNIILYIIKSKGPIQCLLLSLW